MFKSLLLLNLCILGLNSEVPSFEKSMDELFSKMYRVGDPHLLYEEDGEKLKADWNGYAKKLKDLENIVKGELASKTTGLVFNVSELAYHQLLQSTKRGVEIIDKVDPEARKRSAIELNKHVGEAYKVRLSLMSALHEAKKDTKIAIPILTCYLKKYMAKIIAVYKDNEGIKATVQEANDYYVKSIVQLLEKERGPAADHCELSEASSNPSPHNSFLIPLIEAIQNIQDHK